jgi:hypothetical protein
VPALPEDAGRITHLPPYCSHPWYLPRRLMWTGARLRKRHPQGPKTTLAHASSSSSSTCFDVARKKDGLAFVFTHEESFIQTGIEGAQVIAAVTYLCRVVLR